MHKAERILQKTLVTSGLSSAQWDTIRAGLKDRAFFSARIEEVRYLQTAQKTIADMLAHQRNTDGAITNRAHAVSQIMQAARTLGLGTSTNHADLQDPSSEARAKVIVDTNAGLAAGYAHYLQATTYGARLAYPAQELIRVEHRKDKRNWRAIWLSKGGKLYGPGRMIALKDHPIWTAISRFGVPYPPYDYNSGMGLEDISHEEAVTLGIIPDTYLPPKASPVADFNATLEADLTFTTPHDPHWQHLKDIFGDQIKYQAGKIKWQGDILKDITTQILNHQTPTGSFRLGIPSPTTLHKFSHIPGATKNVTGKNLTLKYDTLSHIIERHHDKNETHPNNAPLTTADIQLIPHIWRHPDTIKLKENAYYVEKTMTDNTTMRLILIKGNTGLDFNTAYKLKEGSAL